ncbi:MAG: molybdenum cofactor guanylyltransferase [Acidimicrobiia bacterium]
MITHTVGAVLAGGSGSRMGSPKTELEYLGVPFVDHVIATLSLVLDEVVLCGGTDRGSIRSLKDPIADGGPLAGILAALHHAAGRPVTVVPVDMPLITVDLIERLADPEIEPDAARVASDGTTVQPLCATYGGGLAAMIEHRLAAGRRSVLGFVDEIGPVEYIIADRHTLTNVNTPQEYAELTGGAVP